MVDDGHATTTTAIAIPYIPVYHTNIAQQHPGPSWEPQSTARIIPVPKQCQL
jgi:hypothetical protein